MSIDFGLTTIASGDATNDIFATPPSPFKNVSVTFGTLEATDYKRGQVIIENSDGTYNAAANKAAVAAATRQLAILIESVAAAATGTTAPAIVAGNFIQQKLTPADIPLGSYNFGNIIIGKEVD
mgnify:CR=1 FL=1